MSVKTMVASISAGAVLAAGALVAVATPASAGGCTHVDIHNIHQRWCGRVTNAFQSNEFLLVKNWDGTTQYIGPGQQSDFYDVTWFYADPRYVTRSDASPRSIGLKPGWHRVYDSQWPHPYVRG